MDLGTIGTKFVIARKHRNYTMSFLHRNDKTWDSRKMYAKVFDTEENAKIRLGCLKQTKSAHYGIIEIEYGYGFGNYKDWFPQGKKWSDT